jgi:hypothetical protein
LITLQVVGAPRLEARSAALHRKAWRWRALVVVPDWMSIDSNEDAEVLAASREQLCWGAISSNEVGDRGGHHDHTEKHGPEATNVTHSDCLSSSFIRMTSVLVT